MANELSPPRSRRLSKVVSFCLAYGYIFVVFSVVGGVFVGFALMAFGGSGLPSDVRRVIGMIFLIDGLLAGVAALFFIVQWLGLRPAARSPQRELHVILSPQGSGFEVSGLIVNAPTHLAPFSQQSCVLWHIALVVGVYVGSGDASYTRWDTVWQQSRIPDLEIQYDRTRTFDSRPEILRDSPQDTVREGRAKVTDAPGGTITIPSGAIRLAFLQSGQTFPISTANLQILDKEGLPAELHGDSVKFRKDYKVREFTLTTGNFVRGHQQVTIATEQWMPDPNAPFELGTLSQEQGNVMGCGFLAVVFLVGMLVLLVFGYAFLQR
jgi:hypothetical protein